jgi:ADP-ribosyl-[dinitrogen reductase] hydrolase
VVRVAGSRDRKRGAFLGLAIGDALGAAVEFAPRGGFEPVVGFRGGGPHGLKPGEWTDDTSMAIALADSIVSVGWDLNDQTRRYLAWWRTGAYSVNGVCFDIGNTTRAALCRFEQTGDARTSGNPDERASGNGSIMRLAPVPIHFAHLFPERLDELASYAVESSIPTHASPVCTSACAYLCVLLAGLINGSCRAEATSPEWHTLKSLRRLQPLHPAISAIADGSFREKDAASIRGSGYVADCLEAALWAFSRASSFREAVLSAVNLGDDADTTGAVCGQLAGACWGESGIPEEWLKGLARRDFIEQKLRPIL